MWERWIAPDAAHRIPLACRAMLIEERDASGAVTRRILCEAGVGAFFPPKLRDRYGVEGGGHRLLQNLASVGLEAGDIDVIVLSHLHFDHAGGLLAAWEEADGSQAAAPALAFPDARYVVGATAWDRALRPHPRDRASFIPALQPLLEATGRLERVADDAERSDTLGPHYRLHRSDGHTPGQRLIEVPLPGGPVVFGGDLIPGMPWVHLPITMGYDRFPERLIDEKTALLADLHARGGRLVFTHDPEVAVARVTRDARGRYRGEPVDAPLT